MNYLECREKYPVFQYHGYVAHEDHENLFVTYHFSIPTLAEFSPTWTFPKTNPNSVLDGNKTLSVMLDDLGLTELVSYWKLTMSPRVELLSTSLDEASIAFYKKLYYHGLGEYFYLNHIEIDMESFMDIIPLGQEKEGTDMPLTESGKRMIPIGGGKDSAVTLEVLSSQKDTSFCFAINPRGAVNNTVLAAGYDDSRFLKAKRTLAKEMLELNKQGFLNGHTPFSAIVAFSGAITAYINGIRDVVLSNEGSANESTVLGSTVNHQYSKSLEFEADVREYMQNKQKSGINYFSLLRPLSEYQIAAYFAKHKKYHDIFRSCNKGSKEDIWCGACPKCLFVYLILSPFLSEQELISIFGHRLTDDENLLSDFEKLTGLLPEKPFECVGSRSEVIAAITEAMNAMDEKDYPMMFRKFQETALYQKNTHPGKNFLGKVHSNHFLLPHYYDALKQAMDLEEH
ncbi:MAG: hypothetical protein II359_01565 [Clostridia bacterium]|nr:hypothetical protein [Clostridia bacterium]